MDMASITSLTKSGLKDWFIQRVSALIIIAYIVFITSVILSSAGTDNYYSWLKVFQNPVVEVFTILTFISLIAHAWVGMWTIFTDYIKCSWLAGILQITAIMGYLTCFIWLICILFRGL